MDYVDFEAEGSVLSASFSVSTLTVTSIDDLAIKDSENARWTTSRRHKLIDLHKTSILHRLERLHLLVIEETRLYRRRRPSKILFDNQAVKMVEVSGTIDDSCTKLPLVPALGDVKVSVRMSFVSFAVLSLIVVCCSGTTDTRGTRRGKT